jgi:hypothetical protein
MESHMRSFFTAGNCFRRCPEYYRLDVLLLWYLTGILILSLRSPFRVSIGNHLGDYPGYYQYDLPVNSSLMLRVSLGNDFGEYPKILFQTVSEMLSLRNIISHNPSLARKLFRRASEILSLPTAVVGRRCSAEFRILRNFADFFFCQKNLPKIFGTFRR